MTDLLDKNTRGKKRTSASYFFGSCML